MSLYEGEDGCEFDSCCNIYPGMRDRISALESQLKLADALADAADSGIPRLVLREKIAAYRAGRAV